MNGHSAERDLRRSLCLWCHKSPPMGDYLHARFICEECAAIVTPPIGHCRACGSAARGDEFRASSLCQTCLCGPLPTCPTPPAETSAS